MVEVLGRVLTASNCVVVEAFCTLFLNLSLIPCGRSLAIYLFTSFSSDFILYTKWEVMALVSCDTSNARSLVYTPFRLDFIFDFIGLAKIYGAAKCNFLRATWLLSTTSYISSKTFCLPEAITPVNCKSKCSIHRPLSFVGQTTKFSKKEVFVTPMIKSPSTFSSPSSLRCSRTSVGASSKFGWSFLLSRFFELSTSSSSSLGEISDRSCASLPIGAIRMRSYATVINGPISPHFL